jgi:glucokinase
MVAGDPAATTVWHDATDALARALATYISLLAPELIVVGGGLSAAGEVLLEPLRRRLRELLVWQQVPRIVTAHLGENAACLGAGLLARQAIAQSLPSQPLPH